ATDTPARARAAATIGTVAASSVIHSGAALTRTPGTTVAASATSTSQPSSRPSSDRAPYTRPPLAALHSTPIASRHGSAMPRTGAPPMIPDTPTTGAGPATR